MATEEGVRSAQEVSEAFVDQYFLVLRQQPDQASKFYAAGAVVSRPRPDGSMMTFNSNEAINEQIISCDYENTTFEVLSIDSQSSLEDGIFFMVVGFVTGKDNRRRKFSQMFYLARQKDYDVLNDIFRYVDDDESTPKTLPLLEPAEKVKPADGPKKTEKSVSASVQKNDVAKANVPLENGKVKHSDEKAVTAQKPVAEIVAPQLDGAKRSYVAIVQSMAQNVAPLQVKAVKAQAPVQKPKNMGQPRAAGAPQKPASVSNSVKKFDHKINEEPGTSIFVANLPMNAMPPQLHELFKDFGPIKENGIQVRSSRGQTSVCFGFISFESASSVQSVLQAAKNTPFMLADRKLRVKEKEVDYDGSKQSGKTRSGSGGSKTQAQAQAQAQTQAQTQTQQTQAQNGSAASADDGDEFTVVRSRRNRGGGSGGSSESKTQNGSADGEDEFKPVKSRRN
ncbi:hypothetical protein CARUB_v10021291mg, partial [Capsella rubella]